MPGDMDPIGRAGGKPPDENAAAPLEEVVTRSIPSVKPGCAAQGS